MEQEDFYELIAKRYPEELILYSTDHQRYVEHWIDDYIQKLKGKSLVDYGCGKGRHILKHDGFGYGVDISPTNVMTGEIRARLMGKNDIHFLTADVSKPLNFNYKFNAFLMSETVDFLPDLGFLLANLYQNTTKGAVGFVTAGSKLKKFDKEWIKPGDNLKRYIEFTDDFKYYHKYYTPEELGQVFEEVFDVAESGYIGTTHCYVLLKKKVKV